MIESSQGHHQHNRLEKVKVTNAATALHIFAILFLCVKGNLNNEASNYNSGNNHCLQGCLSSKNHRSKCQIICHTESIKSANPAERLKRSKRTAGKTTTFETIKKKRVPRKATHGCSFDFHAIVSVAGIENSKARNIRINYSRHRNKTVARVEWDRPNVCQLEKRKCRGYAIWWTLELAGKNCHFIHNLTVTYFILSDTAGFDGATRFGIDVFAFPTRYPYKFVYTFMAPPAPESLNKSRTVYIPTLPSDITSSGRPKRPRSKSLTTTLNQENSQSTASESQQHPATTFIISLTLFIAFALGLLGLAATWYYRRLKKRRHEAPTHRPDYKNVIKGTIYISYLPENTTINQALRIYSWLKSHGIDVVMDRMFDPTLYNSLGPKRFGEKFVSNAEKVIMLISPGYLKLCWLDDTVDINSKPILNSLDMERLYSEVTYIKNELSTTLNHTRNRFIPVLFNTTEDHLPNWLGQMTTVTWPNDGKSDRFLRFLKGDSDVYLK